MRSPHERVALQAVEFWSTVAEVEIDQENYRLEVRTKKNNTVAKMSEERERRTHDSL